MLVCLFACLFNFVFVSLSVIEILDLDRNPDPDFFLSVVSRAKEQSIKFLGLMRITFPISIRIQYTITAAAKVCSL